MNVQREEEKGKKSHPEEASVVRDCRRRTRGGVNREGECGEREREREREREQAVIERKGLLVRGELLC